MTTETKPAYLLIQIVLKDFNAYMERYVQHVMPQLTDAGAEILVATADADVIEGTWPANWTVVIRFPGMEAAKNWYNSPAYEPLKALRRNELSDGGNAVFVDSFDPATLNR